MGQTSNDKSLPIRQQDLTTETHGKTRKQQQPVLIIGAGLVGLTLAQVLKQNKIPFRIFDRDDAIDSHGGGGWAITLHWVMECFEKTGLIPRSVMDGIRQNHVQPEVLDRDSVPVRFVNLESGEARFERDAVVHLRVDRSALRRVLAGEGVGDKVEWGKKFERFEVVGEDEVRVSFEDGTVAEGCMVAACDGKNSLVRKQMFKKSLDCADRGQTVPIEQRGKLQNLPIGFIGLQLKGTAQDMKAFRDIAPIFWQGCHPETGYFIFCSMLSTPQANGSAGQEDEYYEVQLNMSWDIDETNRNEDLSTNEKKLKKMKNAATAGTGFHEPLRKAILNIPENVKVLDIQLQDWPSEKWDWSVTKGKVTLLGDAAHPMTMYRGQAANHGMYDAVRLGEELVLWHSGLKSLDQSVDSYEKEMIPRGREAALLSRQACFEAHHYHDIGLNGPLMSLVAKPASVEARLAA